MVRPNRGLAKSEAEALGLLQVLNTGHRGTISTVHANSALQGISRLLLAFCRVASKFPIRLSEFDFPDNAWVGTTVDCQARVANAEKAFRKVKAGKKWLSCEPLIEPLHFETLEVFDWLVIGGASASTETPAWVPPRAWIEQLHSDARKAGLRVYLKKNSGILTQEFLWDDPTEEPTEAPAALRYLIPKDQKA